MIWRATMGWQIEAFIGRTIDRLGESPGQMNLLGQTKHAIVKYS
jgi:hypothetical protein